jgi:hypothetical protein
VEDLEALPQPAQDGDRVLFGRLVHEYGLEAALQSGVLLDVLAVLVKRGGPDHVQLATGQHRLEHVAGVHRAFRGTGAHHRVQLVDEQQDLPGRGGDFREHRLEPLLELAAVLGAGHQRAHIEGEHGLIAQPFGYVAVGDALGEALHDGGLADPGVTDEYRVVLGLAGQDLHHAPDLGVASDDRVEPARTGVGDKVATVLGERLVGRLRHRRRDPLVAADRGQRLEEPVAGEPLGAQQPTGRCPGTLVEQGDHQVLDRDVLVLEPLGLPFGGVQQARQPLGHEHLPGGRSGAADPRPAAQLGFHLGTQRVGIGTGRGQQAGYQSLGLVEQRQQQVLAVDLGVPEAERLGLGVVQRFL